MMHNNKTIGFPTVHYPSLIEFPERRQFMSKQLDKYNIARSKLLLTERYDKIKQHYNLIGDPEHISWGHPGNIISYITLIKDWYDTSDEEYGFFCDDDIDFMTIDRWNFTWKEFVSSLPEDWECIQLIRIEEWAWGVGDRHINVYNETLVPSLTIRERRWCDYGTCFLLKRSYAKKILERHYIDQRTINTAVVDRRDKTFFYWPIIENVLFKELGVVYNFPLFVENCSFESFLKKQMNIETELHWNLRRHPHTTSRKIYENMWNQYGLTADLREMLKVV